MAVNLSPIGNGQQFFSNLGLPLNGGLLYVYQAGSTSPVTTYTDPSGLVANSNPIILGTDGRPPQEIWLTDGYSYKFVLANSDNITIGTYDNIYGIPNAVSSGGGTTIPAGLISLWSGSIGSIPAGWLLCDGNNSTPDLRDRFIVGAGNNYSVGGQGGSADAIVVSHTHTATSVVTDPGHTHTLTDVSDSATGTGYVVSGADTLAADIVINSNTTGITVATTNTSTGVSGTNANLPPYYALAYIMKS